MQGISFPSRNAVEIGSMADPKLGSDEVLIEVKASGICHTDFEVLKSNYGTSAFPVVPGHEYVGVIADKGANVSGLSVGDRVAVDPNLECGQCRACAKGWAHLCENLGAYGVTVDGGFADFSAVKASAVHQIGKMSFASAALTEPMGCVLNGVDAVHHDLMENALIFGAGPMGILMGIALKTRGVQDVIFCDLDDHRLELAAGFGVRGLAPGAADLEAMKHSVDLVVDATGVPAVAGSMVDYAANGGSVHFFGVCPADARIEISPFEVFRRQLTLVGSHSLNHNIPAALETISASGAGIEKVVSHQLNLDEIGEIFRSGPPKGSLKIQASWD